MKKFVLAAAIIAGLMLLFGLQNRAVAGECSAKHSEMLYTTVLVDTKSGSGSGTVIYSAEKDGEWATYILTNYHVIRTAIRVREEWDSKQGKKIEKERRQAVKAVWFDYNDCSRSIGNRGKTANIVAYDKAADLALLKLVDTERGVNQVAAMFPENDFVTLGDQVWAVGAGLGIQPFMTVGLLSFQDQQIDGYRYMLSSAPIIFGNSGGALFTYSAARVRYELIGVPSRVSAMGWGNAVPHMAWSIPISTVREFIRHNDLGEVIFGDAPKEEKEEEKEASK